jgi:predicted Rossmann fold flavoprotein
MTRAAPEILIVGAGPAGLLAAMAAGQAGRRACVCERLSAPGRKLLATGGGRCNLTHDATTEELIAAFGRHGRFAQNALRAFPPESLRAFFAAAGVPTVVQEDGCVFPTSQQARDVLAALLRDASRAHAEVICNCAARRLVRHDGRVAGVETADGFLAATRVVLAAGGRGYPALGSDGSGFQLAADAGHTLTPPVPALVPLVAAEEWPRALAGLVLEQARVRLDGRGEPRQGRSGPLLFTHRGVSGPPVLDLSGAVAARLAAHEPARLLVAARPDRDAAAWRACFEAWRASYGRRALHNLLAGELPRNLAQALCRLAGLEEDATPAQARRAQVEALAHLCAEFPVDIQGTEGWEHAMVTRGGVALAEVDPRTLQSRRVPGLFFAGELLDLDGPCGGYNLTWAFASGRLAGTAAAS